jgi:hypothetical protein
MKTIRHGNRSGTDVITLAGIILSIALPFQLSAAPSYEIGEIPDQRIWYGLEARLEFEVAATALGEGAVIEMTVTEADSIEGTVAFDSTAGIFAYDPAENDGTSFTVRFTALLGENGVRQDVRITPLPRLPAEAVVFGNDPIGDLPDPADSTYVEVTTNTVDNGSETFWFNTLDREALRSITVTGHTVIFQEGHANDLWNLHNSEDIQDLTIHADTLIIRDALHLPQTAVTIHAREVLFEDQEEKPRASLSTVPRSTNSQPEKQVDGRPGHDAGDLVLFTNHFAAEGDDPRFCLGGGAGERAGQGIQGNDGDSRSVHHSISNGIYKWTWEDDNTIYSHFDGFINTHNGSTTWPTDGTDALPGGAPGPAGDGGLVTSTIDVSSWVQNPGGMEGTRADYVYGGSGGSPRPAYRRYFDTKRQKNFETHYSASGNGWYPVQSAKPVGLSPEPVELTGDLRWISPMAMEKILIHLGHAYQKNHFGYVEEQVQLYVEMIELATESPKWAELDPAWAEDLLQILDELRTMRHRVGSNLDFFGNPAGWVPMLSFEVNKIAFENEISRALNIMYLNYWLGNKATDLASRIDAMTTLRGEIRDQIETDRNDYGNLVDSIPGLEFEAGRIEREINQTKIDIETLKNDLLEKAKRRVLLKKSAVILGGIAQVFPIGQPLVGIAGTIVSGFASADPDQPVGQTLLSSGINAAGFFSKSLATKKANDAKLKAGELDLNDLQNQQNQAIKNKLREMQGPIMDVLGESYNQMANSQSPSSEVEAELQRILADTPEYKEMVKEIKELNKEKQAFAAKLAGTMQQVARLSLAITRNLVTIDTLNREIQADSLAYDPRTASLLEVMNERARERLLKYHYFMARAFEYRMLQPYEGELDLNAVFDEFETLATNDAEGDHVLDPDQFDSLRGVYESQISDITFTILDRYNSNRPSLSAPVRILMRPDFLDTLNAGKTATLNFHDLGLFLPDQENLRIVDLKVIELGVDYIGNKDDIVYADIEFQHTGESLLNRDGEAFLFRHYNEATKQKIEWSTRFDPYYGDLDPVQPAAAEQSLLQALLTTESNAPTTEDLLLYSRPAARADLAVKCQINAHPGANMKITRMRVELVYDFTRKDETIKALRFVETADGIRPPILVTPSDLNGRAHGEGAFERSYDIGTQVSVEVPEVYGHYRFAGWEGSGFSDSSQAVTTIAVSDNVQVRPVYTYAEDCTVAVEGGMGDGTYLEGDTIELEAFVPEGHRFIQWQGGDIADPESPTTHMVVSSDAEVSAITAAIQAVWLENISARTRVGTGSNVLIPGFVIEGVVPKQVLIRAVGPELATFYVGGYLEDPTMTVFTGQTPIATNDDWSAASNAAELAAAAVNVGAFPLSAGSKDAAVLVSLDPGPYTVKVSGVGETVGVSLVEVYDTDSNADGSRLINISGRALVGTGADILIPGFVVEGSSGKSYLIRAVGPTLETLGVTGVLANPTLTVIQDGFEVASNDDWGDVTNLSELTSVSQQVGAFPLNDGSADAAVYLTLDAGRYSIKVSGVGNTTGVALVEIYEVVQP